MKRNRDRYLGVVCVGLVILFWSLDHTAVLRVFSLYAIPLCLATFVRSVGFTYGLTFAALAAIAIEGYHDSMRPDFQTVEMQHRAGAMVAIVLVAFLNVRLQRAFVSLEDRNAQLQVLNANLHEVARVNRVMLMGEMTASIAHEINQPLAGIVANAGTCLRYLAAANTEAVREYLELIVRDGRRVSEIISRVRALARRASPKREPIDLNGAVMEAVALVEGQLERHSTGLQLELADDLPNVPADRIQLQQVLLNLIVNAMEAMKDLKDRERTVVVALGRADDDHAFVEVRDNGHGLTDAERLFKPFYTTKSDGMGMGLAISRMIVEAHGGELRAGPNVPEGAVFRMSLPLKEVET